MVRGRIKVSVRVRGWRLMGRVYGWAKAKVRVRLTQTQRQCGFELGLELRLGLGLGLGRLGLGCSDITTKLKNRYDLGKTIWEGRARGGGTVRVRVKVMGCVGVRVRVACGVPSCRRDAVNELSAVTLHNTCTRAIWKR